MKADRGPVLLAKIIVEDINSEPPEHEIEDLPKIDFNVNGCTQPQGQAKSRIVIPSHV
jgi:hypothetical protein